MKFTVREMTLISLFAALTAIGAFIKVPTPIPFTLQFLFCTYAGLFLGAKNGLYSQALYMLIGLIGIPVFTNGGGPAYVLQPTFGYLIGFAACAYIVGKIVDISDKIRFWPIFGTILCGLIVVYLFGVSHLYLIVNLYLHKEMTVMAALVTGFLPYVVFDVLQGIIIAMSAVRIIPILRRSGYLKNTKQAKIPSAGI